NCLDTIRLLLLLIHPPPSSTLFPYTTLFRSELGRESEILQVLDARGPLRRDLGPGRTVEGGVDLDQVQVGGQVADRVETPLLAGGIHDAFPVVVVPAGDADADGGGRGHGGNLRGKATLPGRARARARARVRMQVLGQPSR